jgi:hypothetical protein
MKNKAQLGKKTHSKGRSVSVRCGRRLGLLHPRSGEPCSFEEWKRAEIARIMEKDE